MNKSFIDKAKTKEAKEGLILASEIADLICFYALVYKNIKEMMKPWEP